MSKELPYFKFYPGEWLTGDITLCSIQSQGLFISICSFYWMKECDLNTEKLTKRFSGKEKYINELIHNDIIKVNDDMRIQIEFLDEQFTDFKEISKTRQKAGHKGGIKSSRFTDIERKNGEQVYVLIFSDENEKFLKIGATLNSISRRYSVILNYKIETIYQYFTENSSVIEGDLQEKIKNYTYTPKHKYPGYMESYSMECIDIIDEYFQQINIKPLANHKQNNTKSNQYIEDKDKDKDIIYSSNVEEIFNYSLQYFDKKYLTDAWKDDIKFLLEKDNYSMQLIKDVIKLAREDEFWGKNFISPLKLRSKDKYKVKYIDKFIAMLPKKQTINNQINSSYRRLDLMENVE